MYKNQLQELAQRSCFNLPSYVCKKEGPDHAPRFKASVTFNGEVFESPTHWPTLRLAEHSAAHLALSVLSSRGPSSSLTARVLDESGIYKNLLQETAHKAGLKLPAYTTVRSGPGHVPIFTCTVELAGLSFTGDPAKTKKQAEKNAAWSALNKIPEMGSLINKEETRAVRYGDQKQTQMQSQARRRVLRGDEHKKDGIFGQKWRFLDLLSKNSTQGSVKKDSSFVSLLPLKNPPNRSLAMDKPEPKSALAQALEEHLRDEEKWLGSKHPKPYQSSSCSLYRPFPLLQPSGASSMVDQKTPTGSQSPIAPPVRSRTSLYTGGSHPARRMAPAVQIRSVIPVCAAPGVPKPKINKALSQEQNSSHSDSDKNKPSLV